MRMRKYLPTIAMLAGTLIAAVPAAYAAGRMWYVYSTGAPVAVIKTAAANVTLMCLFIVPFGLLAIGGGWMWRRNDREIEQEQADAWLLRQQRPEKPFRLRREPRRR
jgi:hypothetical protein